MIPSPSLLVSHAIMILKMLFKNVLVPFLNPLVPAPPGSGAPPALLGWVSAEPPGLKKASVSHPPPSSVARPRRRSQDLGSAWGATGRGPHRRSRVIRPAATVVGRAFLHPSVPYLYSFVPECFVVQSFLSQRHRSTAANLKGLKDSQNWGGGGSTRSVSSLAGDPLPGFLHIDGLVLRFSVQGREFGYVNLLTMTPLTLFLPVATRPVLFWAIPGWGDPRHRQAEDGRWAPTKFPRFFCDFLKNIWKRTSK